AGASRSASRSAALRPRRSPATPRSSPAPRSAAPARSVAARRRSRAARSRRGTRAACSTSAARPSRRGRSSTPRARPAEPAGPAGARGGRRRRFSRGGGASRPRGAGVFPRVPGGGWKMGLSDEPPPFAFLNVVVDQTGNQVQLKVESNGNTLTSLAETKNEREVAQALDAAHAAAPGDTNLNDVFAQLNPLLASDVSRALNAMTGEQ